MSHGLAQILILRAWLSLRLGSESFQPQQFGKMPNSGPADVFMPLSHGQQVALLEQARERAIAANDGQQRFIGNFDLNGPVGVVGAGRA
jgi:hypothetical protein